MDLIDFSYELYYHYRFYLEGLSILFLICLPLILLIICIIIPNYRIDLLRYFSLIGSFIILLYSLLLLYFLDLNQLGLYNKYILNTFSIHNNILEYSLGLDILSLIFIILTTILMLICFLINWNNIKYFNKEFIIGLFFLEFIIFNIFCCLNLLLFYIFFESVLIPMFLVIGIWGSRRRKIHASYQFFMYTFFGSIFMLIGIFWLFYFTNSLNFMTLTYIIYSKVNILPYEILIWFSFFLGFAVKIPMLPLHIWLPEAHVEAPTTGSVLLAGILLKLGTYGMLRILLPFFPIITDYLSSIIFVFSLLGIIYSSLVTIRQIDLKKIIAYSSVVHMNFSILGLFSLNFFAIIGSIFLMLSHGIVSGGLFFYIGALYDRYKTRILKYYGGLVQVMPIFAICFFILSFANIGLPGTSSFVGEILTIVGIIDSNFFLISILGSSSILLGAVYAIWLYNRILYFKLNLVYFKKFTDLTQREVFISFVIIFLVIFFGVFPKYLLQLLTDFTTVYMQLLNPYFILNINNNNR